MTAPSPPVQAQNDGRHHLWWQASGAGLFEAGMDQSDSVAPDLQKALPSLLVQGEGSLAAYAALVAEVCGAEQAMLLRVMASGSAACDAASGLGQPIADPQQVLRLHLEHEAASGRGVVLARLPLPTPATDRGAGLAYCGVALRDAEGGVTGLLCVLGSTVGQPAFEEPVPRLLQALAAPLAALSAASAGAGLQRLLSDNMTELAWLCDPDGCLLWCNPAFAERLDQGPATEALVARWRASGRTGLAPMLMRDGRCGWLSTRCEAVQQDGASLQLGMATEVTARVQAQMDLARLAPAKNGRAPLAVGLSRALADIIDRIRTSRLVAAPRLHSTGCDWMMIRCDPGLLEAAVLDLALAQATYAEASPLSIMLSAVGSDHAVLTVRLEPGALPGPDPLQGLPMVQRLLRECGGRVEAGGAPGLRILLPLHWASDQDRPMPAARILVVDDEAVVRMLVVDLLRERGHAVQEAEDAFVAMTRLQGDSELDLMITDIGLPGGFDGSTLARRARQIRPDLPILFITGYAFGTNNDVTLEPGIPVLTKPFTLSILSARITELLSAARVAAAPVAAAPVAAAPSPPPLPVQRGD